MAVTVLMVCHAGRGTGLGHLTRSLAAARLLFEADEFEVRFLVQGDLVEREDLGRFAHRFIPFDGDLAGEVANQVRQSGAGIVVFDLNPSIAVSGLDALLQELRRYGCRLVSIDPVPGRHGLFDLVYVPAFHYSPPEGDDASKFRFGWDHYLLNVSSATNDWKPGRSVLALTGGSDATGLGKTWPALLDDLIPAGFLVHWVVGPYAEAPRIPTEPKHEFITHTGLSGIGSLIGQVNYAVTVYGVTFFELLHYGTPSVVFSPYGAKDSDELAAIALEGVALVARDVQDATARLVGLVSDDALAGEFSRAAKRKLSTGDPHPFVKALQALTSEPCRKDI